MPQILVKKDEHIIEIPILLTAVSGKIRIKNRSILNEYGAPVAVKRDGFLLSNYVEWQIGYDVVKKEAEKLAESSLPETEFIGANGKVIVYEVVEEFVNYVWENSFSSSLLCSSTFLSSLSLQLSILS